MLESSQRSLIYVRTSFNPEIRRPPKRFVKMFDRTATGRLKRMKELPEAGLYEIALVFYGSRHKYICEGDSMSPTLKDGEVVLVDRTAKIEVGDIVVAKQPIEQNTEVVKRVERINERGHYFLVGDNLEESNDSRHYGAVAKENIRGKVVARLS